MKVEFFKHNIEEADIERVCRVLRGLFLTTGPETALFEEKLKVFLGMEHAIALSSATGALHMALEALGVGSGHEVITTPLTFASTVTSICHQGAVPIFVDVEEDSGNLDASLIEQAISPRTRAILPVHLYGQMCDMKAIHAIATQRDLRVVEDAAHALEAERDGVKPGALSDAACFSFYATKNLGCGEGGAAATRDEALAGVLRRMRLHGLSKDASSRYTGGYRHYDVESCGWKYNMDDIHAALLVEQIDRLEGYLKRRQEISDRYVRGFQNVTGVVCPRGISNARNALHLFTIRVDSAIRDQVLLDLQAKEIGVSVNFRPLHLMSHFKKTYGLKEGMFPNAERIGASTITLPLYPKLRDDEVDAVIEAVREAVRKV